MSDADLERRARRRRENALLYSPGEWLWVIGYFGAMAFVAFNYFPEAWPWVAGIILALVAVVLI